MLNRRKHHLFNFIYRVIKSGKPPYLKNELLTFNHYYGTRHNQNFLLLLDIGLQHFNVLFHFLQLKCGTV
ncbi:unnamed protein product [Acanthoscelides obtectus]|uniref:Uncharacterized protein n=1 Tax=Acanthoscelides obtectus TaxID=200917 RepID=A0A9P0M781_ACAOB|nr:unnamed protein product [Acanthoscelides obtectus]CAK1626534.1 hypothetical protein AOBTE_LOCUS3907 [Acanthoscelides obtectus]